MCGSLCHVHHADYPHARGTNLHAHVGKLFVACCDDDDGQVRLAHLSSVQFQVEDFEQASKN
jgi:hypothetical protein